jgi:hypothetical protein
MLTSDTLQKTSEDTSKSEYMTLSHEILVYRNLAVLQNIFMN